MDDRSNQRRDWSLRLTNESDVEFIAELRAVVLRDDLERLGRYDPIRVRQRFKDAFDAAHTWIIVADAVAVGALALRPDGDAVWLEYFYLNPASQASGLGSAVLAASLAELDAAGRDVRLNVLQGSRARRLYERHGFVTTSEDSIDVWMLRRAGR